MSEPAKPQPGDRAPGLRTATCACGGLRVTVTGRPKQVNACTCFRCQRATGSALSYTAFFPESALVAIEGESRVWRRSATAAASHFCPVCGTTVFSRLENMPDQVGISVGCFADPTFEKPSRLYWTVNRHPWVRVREDVEIMETM
jgi:hypothetical protein